MGWPTQDKITIRSLAKFPGVTGKINDVALLGHTGSLKWTHDGEGMTVQLPREKPCDYAVALKITGADLRGFKPELAAPSTSVVVPDGSGTLRLAADDAELSGSQIQVEEKAGRSNIGFWDKASEWASWKVKFSEPGKYRISISSSTVASEALAVLEAGSATIEIKPPQTGSWEKFAESEAGTIEVPHAGELKVKLHARDARSWKPINVRWVKLRHEGS